LAIPTQLHRYREGYLIAILGNPSGGLTDARYYVGRRSILGIFPASENKAYLFYMIPADSMAQIKAGDLKSYDVPGPRLRRTSHRSSTV
jgi:hypothetical protein